MLIVFTPNLCFNTDSTKSSLAILKYFLYNLIEINQEYFIRHCLFLHFTNFPNFIAKNTNFFFIKISLANRLSLSLHEIVPFYD